MSTAKERAATWYSKNKDRAIEMKRERRKDVRKAMIEAAQNRARVKGLPIDLKPEDIEIPEYCPVFGIKLERGAGRHQPSSPSLDRIIPELGYVRGNIQVISQKANAMKNNATNSELIMFAHWILKGGGDG